MILNNYCFNKKLSQGLNMLLKSSLPELIIEALKSYSGTASIVQVCKFIWNNYATDLEQSGDLFYTWQYDIRWAADYLRKKNILKPSSLSPQGVWELNTQSY